EMGKRSSLTELVEEFAVFSEQLNPTIKTRNSGQNALDRLSQKLAEASGTAPKQEKSLNSTYQRVWKFRIRFE
ncbi:MAG: hypothetical protein K2L86_08045, partial [Lachnospiraceae bacterium]|nr:hypothetical protein [Lachnospiraceae bacterium]